MGNNTPTAIETSTGRYVDLLAPDPATIVLGDIAAHLSRIGRYGGACRRFYPVAEHAILVADRLRSQGFGPRTILLGLHHDSHEAYVNDQTRPHKLAVEAADGPGSYGGAEMIEEAVGAAIVEALGLPRPTASDLVDVKAADNWALAAEAWHLMPSQGRGWVTEGLYDPDDHRNPPMVKQLHPPHMTTPAMAEGLFLGQHLRWTSLLADLTAA